MRLIASYSVNFSSVKLVKLEFFEGIGAFPLRAKITLNTSLHLVASPRIS